ncbi:cytochrome P450 71D8-like [Corylus avellana]|uniref:cytochrome P450 71D8-like n=1 Tax=Corylus avellana TaxID=13451 RepID=UPI00286AE49C|nr:cytochrome P450 71D8-like [Corylus avellana]
MLQDLSFPLLTCFFFLFILLNIWTKSKAKCQNHKLPPGPWKLPLIGNLHQLASSSSQPHHFLGDLAKKHGPIMKLQLGEVSAIIISSPNSAKELLKTHDTIFANQPRILAAEVVSYDSLGVFFTPFGDYWRQIRKIYVMELLSAMRVQSFRTIREEEVLNLIKSVSLSGGLPINLSEKVFSLMNRIISRAAFGKECKYENELIYLLKEANSLTGVFNLFDVFPSLKFLSFLTSLEKIRKNLDKILDDIIKDKMQTSAATLASNDDSGGNDVVDVLLEHWGTSELDSNMGRNHIKAITLEVIFAGSETSATTIEWAMSELLRNPRVLEKAQAVVRRVLGGSENIDETDIQKLDYLKLVVKETLRLHPPVALIPRESSEKRELSGYMIPSNTKVFINVWAIGRDPEYWIDADCFRPERFNNSCIDFKDINFEYIPFGGGKRICPGISFALAAIELTLSQLLYHFNWKLPNEIKPEELDMSELLGLACKRRNDLCLVATPWMSPLS